MENLRFNFPANSNQSSPICNKQCRLCLVSLDALLEIFSDQAQQMGINTKLSEFCHLQISEQDIAPKLICFTCLNEVNRFCDFYKRVQDNQKLLALSCSLAFPASAAIEQPKIAIEECVPEFNNLTECSEEEAVANEDSVEGNEDYIESPERTELDGNDLDDEVWETIEEKNQPCRSSTSGIDVSLDTSQIDLQIATNHDESLNISAEADQHVFIFAENDDSTATVINLESYLKSENLPKESKNTEDEQPQVHSIENTLGIESESIEKSPSTSTTKRTISRKRISLDEPIREFFDMKCRLCDANFFTFAARKRHMAQEHNEECFFICCNRKLFRRYTIMEHINYHLNPKKFTCNVCNQICKSKVTLKVHLKQHIPIEDRRFSCEKCGARFVLSSQLKSHMTRHLTDDEKKFICSECGKAFGFRFVLEKHKQNMHVRQKNYMCEICARSFVDKVNLTAHKRTHDPSLPRLECPKCNALLKSKKTLQIHMRVHDPSTFPCTMCDRVFPTKNGLVNHFQYCHSGKKYQCRVCERKFKKSLNLQEHMATHTGDILYNCEHCDKTFNAKANRYAHVKKTHPAEWAEKQKLKWRKQDEK